MQRLHQANMFIVRDHFFFKFNKTIFFFLNYLAILDFVMPLNTASKKDHHADTDNSLLFVMSLGRITIIFYVRKVLHLLRKENQFVYRLSSVNLAFLPVLKQLGIYVEFLPP